MQLHKVAISILMGWVLNSKRGEMSERNIACYMEKVKRWLQQHACREAQKADYTLEPSISMYRCMKHPRFPRHTHHRSWCTR